MSQSNPYTVANTSCQPLHVPTPHVPDYLVWAILETLFCCQPFGIAGIVYAAMALSAKQQGNYQLAMENAEKARWLLLIGVSGYVVIVLIWAICLIFLVL